MNLTREMLAAKGIDATCCMQPEEVMDALRNGDYDAVLTDIQMPAMSGFELVKKIKAFHKEQDGHVPVIAVTARSDMNAAELREYGFDGCLNKPYSVDDLLAVIDGTSSVSAMKTLPDGDLKGERNDSGSYNFGALTAFAGDDVEAAQEIIRTFVEETRKNISMMAEASKVRNAETISAVAHKMLPLFLQINAVTCAASLEWLEGRRGMNDYSDEFHDHVATVLAEAEKGCGGC